MIDNLSVFLNDRLVGSLTRLAGAQCFFGFDDAYANDFNRPTLSQFYLSADGGLRTESRPARSKRLPSWFSNLLPEGPLRTYLARRADVRPDSEFDLLAVLGEDLPGAIRILTEDGKTVHADEEVKAREQTQTEGPLRFSLAGFQLKFSGIFGRHGGMTIPASGAGGDWIVKLPSAIYPAVSENEATMLTLAARIGMNVPEHRLIAVSEIEGLPDLGRFSTYQALAVKRFDRGSGGKRIHIEDLAQVFGLTPDEKYEKVGYARIAEMVGLTMGPAAAQEFVARLVFMVLIGNGDMHLKNWSLIYPNGRTPALAPAYDLVSTIPYIPTEKLALNLAGKKAFSDMTRTRFMSFAQKAKISERETMHTVERTVDLILTAWESLKAETSMPRGMVELVDRHIKATGRLLSLRGSFEFEEQPHL